MSEERTTINFMSHKITMDNDLLDMLAPKSRKYTEKDIELVMNQTNVSKDIAINSLEKCNGDIVDAIMDIYD